jgi:DNA-binding transcriptional LysR family regulator
VVIAERRLRKLDLNLLLTFSVLMRERHVSRAAQRLFVGQPAMSGALARLREALGDELFVRAGRGLEPTARARALAEPIERALESIDRAIHEKQPFAPAHHDGIFRIGLPDNQEIAIVPALTGRLRRVAPHAVLLVRAADYASMTDLLDSGEIDVAVSIARPRSSRHEREALFSQGYACLFSRRQLRLKPPLTVDAYCAHPHALVSFTGELEGVVDVALARIGRSRRVAVAVPRFATLPHVLEQAPLIATVPEPIARCFARAHALALSPPPVAMPPRTVSLVYRRRDAGDAAHAWFRAQVKAIAIASTGAARRRRRVP